MKVEVAYATPDTQKILALDVEAGCTAFEAAQQSGIAKLFPEIDLAAVKMGIFGKAVKADKHALQEGDRVEIYRPLIADPKQSRKARADKAKQKREDK